jgi:hypothetical protein
MLESSYRTPPVRSRVRVPDDRDYEVTVRRHAYLWGSAGIAVDVTFPTPLMLHVGNDVHGEAVRISTETANGVKKVIGKVKPGEYVTIPIQKHRGVLAECAVKSTVRCAIRKA